jgi:DNA polymerase-3 subunit epsilon
MSLYDAGNVPVYLLPKTMYVCADYELTGLNRFEDKIIEIAHLFGDVNGRIIGEWETLVNPGRDTGPVEVHGIPTDMVTGAPSFKEIVLDLAAMLDGKILVSNNNGLDIAALTRQFDESGMLFTPGKPIDITDFATDFKFVDMYAEQIEAAMTRQEVFHRAMPDARLVAELLPLIVEYTQSHPERVLRFEPCRVLERDFSLTL